VSSLSDLIQKTTTPESSGKTAWAKFPKGSESKVVLVADLEGNPKGLPELHVVKKYTVKPKYLSEKEKKFAGPNRGRTIYYVDGDDLHPGLVQWWIEDKKVDDEDVMREYIRQYGMVAYIFNIDAFNAVRKSDERGMKGLTESEKMYATEYAESKGSGSTGDDDSFNGILTYELHAGLAAKVETFYKAVNESGREDWVSNYIWNITRPQEEGNYQVERDIKISKIDDDYLEENPKVDLEAIEEAFAKAASEELALPNLWDTVVNRKRYTKPQNLPPQYSFKDMKNEDVEDEGGEPEHVVTGRGDPVDTSEVKGREFDEDW
jgi:hypothetical protein